MTINDYQKLAMTTLNPELSERDVLINGVMGLCGESGEAIDLVKKWLAQGQRNWAISAGIWPKPPRPSDTTWRTLWPPISKN